MKKRIKKIIFVASSLFLSLSFIGIGTFYCTKNKDNFLNYAQTIGDNKLETFDLSNKSNSYNPLVPLSTFWNNPFLSAKTGPVIQYNNQISALDWYGKVIWTLDSVKYLPSGVNVGNMSPWFGGAIANCDLDYNNSKLYFLTNSSNNSGTIKQNLFRVNVLTGEVEMNSPISLIPGSRYGYYFQVKVLASNKVMLYAQGNSIWTRFDLYDIATNAFSTRNNSATLSMGAWFQLLAHLKLELIFYFQLLKI